MSTSILNPSKKSKRGRPPVDSDQVGIRVSADLLAALDQFRGDTILNPDAPIGRPEAIRRIVKDWLAGHGYLAEKAGAD